MLDGSGLGLLNEPRPRPTATELGLHVEPAAHGQAGQVHACGVRPHRLPAAPGHVELDGLRDRRRTVLVDDIEAGRTDRHRRDEMVGPIGGRPCGDTCPATVVAGVEVVGVAHEQVRHGWPRGIEVHPATLGTVATHPIGRERAAVLIHHGECDITELDAEVHRCRPRLGGEADLPPTALYEDACVVAVADHEIVELRRAGVGRYVEPAAASDVGLQSGGRDGRAIVVEHAHRG